MLRLIVGALIALAVFVPGCKRSTDVVQGGVYAFASPGGDYKISKVLVVDESAVHIRSYKESFKAVPTAIDTSKLTVFIGHAPLAREGFLKDQPKLISVEKVAESELEGYRYYQEAMGAGH
jgi:hypothetical protein